LARIKIEDERLGIDVVEFAVQVGCWTAGTKVQQLEGWE
jgi:hypothetical protein